MSSVTVRNLPEGVKEALANHAQAIGLSLEAFLRSLLESESRKPISKPSFVELMMSLPREALPEDEEDAGEYLNRVTESERRLRVSDERSIFDTLK